MSDAQVSVPPSKAATFSVVIPVRNEAPHIGRILGALLAQDFPPGQFEILVVDGCSTDATVAAVQEFARAHPAGRVRLLHNPRRLSSAARNIGIAHSVHDYIVMVDGHCEIDSPQLLAAAARLLAATGARTLGRPQPFWSPNPAPFEAAVMLARSSRLGHAQDSLIFSAHEGWVSPLSVAVIYHKSLFGEFGAFDERFDAAEDVEFNRRLAAAGIRCYLSPQLRVAYRPRSSLRALLWQLWRYGQGRGRFYRKHPAALTLSAAAPALAVLGGGLLAGLAWRGPGWRTALGCAVAGYALVVVASFRREFRNRRLGLLAAAMGLIPVIHATLGAGLLRGVLRAPAHRLAAEKPVPQAAG